MSAVKEGVVVSNSADKTVTVKVSRRFKHPVYGKYVLRSKKFLAHDENNSCNLGDTVSIASCSRFSKNKSWVVVK